ncbi:von Willebrand factor type A domain-containing protein [Niabella yanshanensis]|uniref:von Willebrand factor type A domain-containing protein n=1 Tax=Niabella yanshanensis TaxID=577386 RepID=A0ABZ0W9D2_9BACT|nr:VWA domain-containing protein [Niabella yanshanensis]WQD39890.1 von Willebrand factor type A domain-containing protein [Niabella yanshanensis]
MKYLKWMFLSLAILTFLAFVQKNVTITGIVTDTSGQPIAHATVQEKGTSNSTSADAKGKFSISVNGSGSVLIITAVGFNQKEVRTNGKSSLKIVLEPATQKMEEVVVTAMGVQRSSQLTGSVAGIVHQTAPGIRIRGVTTLEAKNYNIPNQSELRKKSWPGHEDFSREGYDHITENPFLRSKDNPLSTFSIDVDGASYSNIRRFINNGQLPPGGAVRIEEMINYFSYNYPQPAGDVPFSINTEYTICPWNEKHQLVSIGLQGKKIATENLPAANIVFLIDVSGSMSSPDKLPLVQASMKLLADQLRPQDRVAMVVYAGSAGVVLPSTEGNETIKIKDAIDRLQAGGSTAGGAGIQLAYKIAQEGFIKNGNNRIVLCTDGDFNVGQSSDDALERMIEEKRKSGIFLTVLGYGTGNYQDAKMQKLANKGNGNHAYIDNLSEARKVLISQFGGTMFTIAKDVKLQVEFNPAKVQGYRLIGYENRMLAKEDFNDDTKDAGELGSGHTVTALYEIIPVGIDAPELKNTDGLKYQKTEGAASGFSNSNEVMTVKFRYKEPEEGLSLLLEKVIAGSPVKLSSASENMQLAAGLAQFGMLLRNSAYKGSGNYNLVLNMITPLAKNDREGYRAELIELVKRVSSINKNNDGEAISGNNKKEPALRFLSQK